MGASVAASACFRPWLAVAHPFEALSVAGVSLPAGKMALATTTAALLAALAERWGVVVVASIGVLIAAAAGLDGAREVVHARAALDLQSVGFGLYAVLAGGVVMLTSVLWTPRRRND